MFQLRWILVLLVIATVAASATFVSSSWNTEAEKQQQMRTIGGLLRGLATSNGLDSVYNDSDGNLIADTPTNKEVSYLPSKIRFSFIASDDDENQPDLWKGLTELIATRLKLPVEYLVLNDSREQLEALRSGKLHITAFGSGTVPIATDTCGFVPLCTFGSDDGDYGYKMVFIVRHDSKIKNIPDLRNKKIGFSRPRSNSGCKAAIVLLKDDYNLTPEYDYSWIYTYGHENSIAALVNEKIDAAPVASDILDQMIEKGELDREQIRIIYESERFPPVAFGCTYNLPIEVRNTIHQAFLEFNWEGSLLEREFSSVKPQKFVPVSYKNDWANIRRIDRTIRKLRHENE